MVECLLPKQGKRASPTLSNQALQELYIASRKAERGLTRNGEVWIRQSLPHFINLLSSYRVHACDATRDDVRTYLATIDSPWKRASHFRAIRAFYNFLEREGSIQLSPCHRLQAPKTPKVVLPRPTLPEVHKLLEHLSSDRDRALVCLLMDTGFRLSEVANIGNEDINWDDFPPKGGSNVWGITRSGIALMLRRLKRETGIACNAHAFRRAWTIESIKQGVNLLDVQVLGGWESLDMVRHYAREVNAEDAISRYKPLVT